MTNKILIHVKDGTVQAVYSNTMDLDIVLIDEDTITADNSRPLVSEILQPDAIGQDFYTLFDESSPIDKEIREELKRIHF